MGQWWALNRFVILVLIIWSNSNISQACNKTFLKTRTISVPAIQDPEDANNALLLSHSLFVLESCSVSAHNKRGVGDDLAYNVLVRVTKGNVGNLCVS